MFRFVIATLCMLAWLAAPSETWAELIFSTNFDSGAPEEFSGVKTTTFVQGYAGVGTESDVFAGQFLRNDFSPAAITRLTLTGLAAHTSVDLDFLLAIIDSWDGNTASTDSAPDFFNVRVDGTTIFSQTFDNFLASDQGYTPPPGVQLTSRSFSNRGFNSFGDAAYNMGLDRIFDGIAHTSSTLTIEWFASDAGWQGGSDESWAIDNVRVTLNGTTAAVPEPSTLAMLSCAGAFGFVARGRRRRRAR